MDVLLIASEAPPIASGVARCIENLERGLVDRGHSVRILSSNDIPRLAIGEVRLSSFAMRWPSIRSLMRQADVINVHGPVPTMTDAFLAFARFDRKRRPAIVYTHHCEVDLPSIRPACTLYARVHARLARIADRVVTSTPSYASMLGHEISLPIEAIPWGVDFKRFSRARTVRADGEPLRVLFLGQMRPYKGLDVLIEAVARSPRLRLTIAGGGPLEHQYRALARRTAPDRITFLGRCRDEALPDLYVAHDVIALPSTTRAEAFGLVLLEGMASGCVPVASDLPGVCDVAGPTGVLVEPGNVESLRAGLLRLVERPNLLKELSVRSEERARAMTWPGVASSYEGVYLRAMDAARFRAVAAGHDRRWTHPEFALASIARTFAASWASVILFDRNFKVRAGVGRATSDVLRTSEPKIARYVAEQQEPLLLNDDAGLQPFSRWLSREDVVSAMSVPLEFDGALGSLNVSIAKGVERRFTADDLRDLVRVAAA